MDIKRLVELNIIKQAIKDSHQIELGKELPESSEVESHTHEAIIDRENYSLYLNVSYEVIGKVVSATYTQPSEDNRELGMVTIDEISLYPANSDIEIELGDYEKTLIKSITFV